MHVQWNNIHNLLFNSHENYNTTYNTCRCTRKLYKNRQYNKVLNRTLIGNRGHRKNKCGYYFC